MYNKAVTIRDYQHAVDKITLHLKSLNFNDETLKLESQGFEAVSGQARH